MRSKHSTSGLVLLCVCGALALAGCDSGAKPDEALEAGGEPLPNQFCINPPIDELCSLLPHDITELLPGVGYSSLNDLQRPFDVFGWQMFVALNWPANADGTPSADPIGSAPAAPRVWEFYETPSQVFGLAPDNRVMAAALAGGKRVFRLMAKSDHKIQTSSFLQATGQPLIDRNLNFVVFDLAMNPVEVDYVRKNGLETKAGQEAFEGEISFPLGTYDDNETRTGGNVGAIEIKTSWRLLSKEWGDDPSRYYTIDGTVYVDADDSESGEAFHFDATLGLVGFHIMQRTSGPRSEMSQLAQDWMWASFEHVDNAPLAANARDAEDISLPLPATAEPPASVSSTYSFYNPDYSGPTNEPPKGPYKWAVDPPYARNYANEGKFGTQVVRAWRVFSDTAELNELWQEELAGTVWANYFQLSTQWQGGVEDPTTENGNIPRYLSNTTLETYIQFDSFGSCLDCHSNAKSAAGQDANFSFLLGLAQ